MILLFNRVHGRAGTPRMLTSSILRDLSYKKNDLVTSIVSPKTLQS